jgi:hypothetical protein
MIDLYLFLSEAPVVLFGAKNEKTLTMISKSRLSQLYRHKKLWSQHTLMKVLPHRGDFQFRFSSSETPKEFHFRGVLPELFLIAFATTSPGSGDPRCWLCDGFLL